MRGKRSLKKSFVCWLQTSAGLIVALIPVWFYILTRVAISPQGFWQQLVLGTIFVFFLGGIQIIFLIAFVFWLVAVWGR